MERITFTERANWYTEETDSVEQNQFLKKVLEMHQVHHPIIIPCSSGKNLETLSQASVSVIGYDIDEAMLAMSREKVAKKELLNCKVGFGNLLDFYIPPYTDSILILNEAIQLFKPKHTAFTRIIENILRQLNGILILETFDYKNTSTKERLRYFCGSELNRIIKDYTLEKNRISINRYHQAILSTDGVIIHYYYRFVDKVTDQKKWSKSEVELFFFDDRELRRIVEKNGGRINSVFSTYNMEFRESSAKKIYVIHCFGGDGHD